MSCGISHSAKALFDRRSSGMSSICRLSHSLCAIQFVKTLVQVVKWVLGLAERLKILCHASRLRHQPHGACPRLAPVVHTVITFLASKSVGLYAVCLFALVYDRQEFVFSSCPPAIVQAHHNIYCPNQNLCRQLFNDGV